MSASLDGALVVDKPAGLTSHDVVAAVRRRLPRGTKVGHTGTLDPFATGVLPVVVGRATRLSQFLTASRKRYRADVAFGAATDSGDRTGTPTEEASLDALAALTEPALISALAGAVGTHPQVPPAHSAKKIDGERAYALARRGETVALDAVEVTAHAVTLVEWDAMRHVAVVDLETSAGYYVRSFARDLGQALGVPAHLSALRRTGSGAFELDVARAIGAIVEASPEEMAGWLVPMADLLPHLPALTLDEAQERAVRHGQPFAPAPGQSPGVFLAERVRLLDCGGALVALAIPSRQARGLLHADVVVG
ncbi:tRNA pseudouridine synthase B [Luteitalea sp. TBR-22]|uniref:tRNA pseudouridine(55) synthase TruB n=1 Tax=Luteitalea sp. TBR-22 TaxID=2802971 RepID=UPI001AF8821F|nr:tRNA pseudouridine(55) synthase TruB [Luteitalea sp. TBR-22]BCS34531.1 tRNA pseudouridine synthase B [Luteitalea sp. TBR-22]